MKNFLTVLKERCQNEKENQDDIIEIQKFLYRVKEYWRLYDIDNGTLHAKIYEFLYMKREKISHAEIAEKFYISERTLDRYVVKYNEFAIKLANADYNEGVLFRNVK